MQWLERLNESLDYIEGNLEKGPVTAEAAKIACCSAYHYQRMFSYLAGVPLSEYVRRRRLTFRTAKRYWIPPSSMGMNRRQPSTGPSDPYTGFPHPQPKRRGPA